MSVDERLTAADFAEMVGMKAEAVLLARLKQLERAARVPDTLYLYNAAGVPYRMACAVGPLAERPRVVAGRVADHRAVAGVLVTESPTRPTEQRAYPAYSTLSVLGLFPVYSLTVARTWSLRWGQRGWEMPVARSGAAQDPLQGVWLWRLLPN